MACAATGAGKTLLCWISLFMAIKDDIDAMVIVITPLKLLGKQNVESSGKMGLTGVAVDESANAKTFKVNSAGEGSIALKCQIRCSACRDTGHNSELPSKMILCCSDWDATQVRTDHVQSE